MQTVLHQKYKPGEYPLLMRTKYMEDQRAPKKPAISAQPAAPVPPPSSSHGKSVSSTTSAQHDKQGDKNKAKKAAGEKTPKNTKKQRGKSEDHDEWETVAVPAEAESSSKRPVRRGQKSKKEEEWLDSTSSPRSRLDSRASSKSDRWKKKDCVCERADCTICSEKRALQATLYAKLDEWNNQRGPGAKRYRTPGDRRSRTSSAASGRGSGRGGSSANDGGSSAKAKGKKGKKGKKHATGASEDSEEQGGRNGKGEDAILKALNGTKPPKAGKKGKGKRQVGDTSSDEALPSAEGKGEKWVPSLRVVRSQGGQNQQETGREAQQDEDSTGRGGGRTKGTGKYQRDKDGARWQPKNQEGLQTLAEEEGERKGGKGGGKRWWGKKGRKG